MASESNAILQVMKEHRDEMRADMAEQRGAMVRMADALAELGKTMTRSEERHSSHEAGMKRIGGELDDHELRIRVLEQGRCDVDLCKEHTAKLGQIEASLNNHLTGQRASWKTITVISTVIAAVITIGLAAIQAYIK